MQKFIKWKGGLEFQDTKILDIPAIRDNKENVIIIEHYFDKQKNIYRVTYETDGKKEIKEFTYDDYLRSLI